MLLRFGFRRFFDLVMFLLPNFRFMATIIVAAKTKATAITMMLSMVELLK